MTGPKALVAKQKIYKQEEIAAEIKKAIPNIESKIGKDAFIIMTRFLTQILNCHEGLTPTFLRESLEKNKEVIETFYQQKKKEFPNAKLVTIYSAVLAAVIFGNIYHFDPLILLTMIERESKYVESSKNPRTKAMGIYQIVNADNVLAKLTRHEQYWLKFLRAEAKETGAFPLKTIPKEKCTENVFINTWWATFMLTLKRLKLGKKAPLERVYAAYCGNPDNAGPKAAAQARVRIYEKLKTKYHFVLIKDLAEGQHKKDRDFATVVPIRIKKNRK